MEELDAARWWLQAAGVEVSEPYEITDVGSQAFLQDPDGNLIELHQPTSCPLPSVALRTARALAATHLSGTLVVVSVLRFVRTEAPARHEVIVDLASSGPRTGGAHLLAPALPDEARERFEHRWKERKLLLPGGRKGFI